MDNLRIEREIAAEFDEPGKKKYDLFFNKLNGSYLGYVTHGESRMDDTDSPHAWKTVELDASCEKWVGTITDGSVQNSLDELPRISELDVDKSCHSKIINKYDYYHQLNIISTALLEMGSQNEDLKVMSEFIATARELNESNKTAYSESPNYVYSTKGEVFAEVDTLLEGGLREIVGPWRLK